MKDERPKGQSDQRPHANSAPDGASDGAPLSGEVVPSSAREDLQGRAGHQECCGHTTQDDSDNAPGLVGLGALGMLAVVFLTLLGYDYPAAEAITWTLLLGHCAAQVAQQLRGGDDDDGAGGAPGRPRWAV